MAKYIFVTGGVLSSVGKGVVAASLAKILQKRAIKIGIQKLDPYINVDPGTMSPYQHGEVFVTEDGAETDLDLGHYERFLNINLQRACSVSSGQIYAHVIEKERKGDYLGGTIMVVPHITQAIKQAIAHAADALDCDVLVVEVGGTVGDLEGAPFLEALREMQYEYPQDCLFFHVTWLPHVGATHELKTKPTQHSLRQLRSIGITPDYVILRSDYPVEEDICKKVGFLSSLPADQVFSLVTEKNAYKVPLILEAYGLGTAITTKFNFTYTKEPDWHSWQDLMQRMAQPGKHTYTVGLVGKYVQLHDAYISVAEALHHAGKACDVTIAIAWIDSEEITPENVAQILQNCDAIVVPGGFGDRGVEGKILTAHFARTHNIPYLGLCLGMQVMCIEMARAHIDPQAHSLEFNPNTPTPVIAYMDSQKNVTHKGGTMRLGTYPCKLRAGSKAADAYKNRLQDGIIHERHRHRFECNPTYRAQLEQHGLLVSGESPDGTLVEVVEVVNHPFMVGSQYHPEFLSRPEQPHPLFIGLVQALKKIKPA